MIPKFEKSEGPNGPGAVVDGKETELDLKETRYCIEPKVLELLQEQIKHELFAERLYLSIATWMDWKGYPATADFFEDHAKEEKKHAKDFIKFISMRGEHALLPDTEQPTQEFESAREAVDMALDHEYFITDRIKNIYDVALQQKDFTSLKIAKDYIKEQVEEEQLFISLSNYLKLCGDVIDPDFELEVEKIHKRKEHIVGKY